MQEKDIQRLFTHIRGLLPNCKTVPRLTHTTANALCKAFDGYSYEQIEAAATQCAHEKPFWPDTSELSAHLPKLGIKTYGDDDGAWMREWCAEWQESVHKAGLITAGEAKDQGMSVAEWARTLNEAGL